MTEYDQDWEDFYNGSYPTNEVPKLRAGHTLSPTSVDSPTGCGIIIQTEVSYQESTLPCIKMLTDFGNVVRLSMEDILIHYKVTGFDDDLCVRIDVQIRMLKEIQEGLSED